MKRKRRTYYRIALLSTVALSILSIQLIKNHYESRIDDLLMEVEALETQSKELLEIEVISNEFEVCAPDSTFKSWMSYTKITATTSDQYMYQQKALTNANGIRVYEGHLMVAMSKTYGDIGDTFKITFEDGNFILAIIGDIKDGTECTHPDGSMLEFIVDPERIPEDVKASGDFNKLYEGVITSIERG